MSQVLNPAVRVSVLCCALGLLAAMAPAARGDAALQAKVSAYLARSAPKGVDISVTMLDVASGKVLAEVGGMRPMAPASNLKLVTSAAALDVLGPDFQFETKLLSRPAPAGGAQAKPSLVVVGDGDPAFFDVKTLAAAGLAPAQVIAAWCQAAKAASPAGFAELIVDDRIFDAQGVPPTWPKDQLDEWYGVGASGLNFHDNVLAVTPRPNASGGVDVEVFPFGDFIQVRNTAKASRVRKEERFIVNRIGNTVNVSGVVPYAPDEPFRVTLPDAPLNFGQWFAGKLAAEQMAVGPVRRPTAQEPQIGVGDRVIHQIQTPLQAVLNRTNRDSYNLYAECMLKRMAVKATGHQGTFAQGCAVVRQAVAKRLGEDALAGMHQVDGCGLSKQNRVTTRMMAQLVASVGRDPKIAAAYRLSLARPGMEGSTFAHRFQHAKLGGDVYGKSGYISGVSALTGMVVHEKSGQSASFSILCNATGPKAAFDNRTMKRIQEDLVKMLDQEME